MTLEEAKRLADNGDVGAMMALAEYYVGQKDNDEDAIDIAYEYYERAATAGDLTAILRMAESSNMTADAFMVMMEKMGPDEYAIMGIEKAHRWAVALRDALRQGNLHGDTEEYANKIYLESIVRLSTVYFFEDDFDGILRITENADAPMAKALHGMALFKQAETDSELETAFTFLKNAEHVSFWKESYMHCRLTEAVMIEAANILCNIYRIIYKNIDAAYNVLSIMYANANSAEMREEILEKLSKYRQNRRGKYEHIGS